MKKIFLIIISGFVASYAGIAFAASADSDLDGYSDAVELSLGTDPFDAASVPADNDRDLIPDEMDDDDDNDTVADEDDAYPFNPSEWLDTDGDGVGNNADADDDNDCYSDAVEAVEGTSLVNPASIPPDNDDDCRPDSTDSDDDNDGVFDSQDAFPTDSAETLDTDGDEIGDNADTDDDNDGMSDAIESSLGTDPKNANSRPGDFDGDGNPDALDSDDDNDGVSDSEDVFPRNVAEFEDTDGDGTGDNADTDDDNDLYSDALETQVGTNPKNPVSRPLDFDRDLIPDSLDPDDDNDGVLDVNDVFPFNASESGDSDRDAIGNNADPDDDNDGYSDALENQHGTDPSNPALKPADNDRDFAPDDADQDDDNDGVLDIYDPFSFNSAEWQDTDSDGAGNNADTDDDNDGYSDELEIAENSNPLNSNSRPIDLDKDLIPDDIDTDDDNDSAADVADAFPKNAAEWIDTDRDGLGNNADLDDDGDGYRDIIESTLGTNSLDSKNTPPDNDKDFIPNVQDPDDDNDNILDARDIFPFDSSETKDSDNDGTGDNSDKDNDNDGVMNLSDALPFNPKEQIDTDGDGLGNIDDTDDDNDGILDEDDIFPLDAKEWSDLDGDKIGDNSDGDSFADGFESGTLTNWAIGRTGAGQIKTATAARHFQEMGLVGIGPSNINRVFPVPPNFVVLQFWTQSADGGSVEIYFKDVQGNEFGDRIELSGSGGKWVGIRIIRDSVRGDTVIYKDGSLLWRKDADKPGILIKDFTIFFVTSSPVYLDDVAYAVKTDFDGDGKDDAVDEDSDNDGVINETDSFPMNFYESADTNNDGTGDNEDPDDDNDGISDEEEIAAGLDSNDSDNDDDGMPDGMEVEPLSDTDGDGLINAADPDSDNDGIPDGVEMGLAPSMVVYSDSLAKAMSATQRGSPNLVFDMDSSTVTSPVHADTDTAGLSDGREDRNGNGKLETGERNPLEAADDTLPDHVSGGSGGCALVKNKNGSGAGIIIVLFALLLLANRKSLICERMKG